MIPPSIREFFDEFARLPAFVEAVRALRRREPADLRLTGLDATAEAIAAVLLHRAAERPVVIVVESNEAADELAATAAAVYGLLAEEPGRAAPLALPALDVSPYDGLSPHAAIAEKRGLALWRLADGSASVVVAPLAAALLKTSPPEAIRGLAWPVKLGDEFYLEDLEALLHRAGYVRNEPVEMVGQYSIRGGILDVYSPESADPVRIEMLGDAVESIREFDPETQKSRRKVPSATLLPLTEHPAPGEDEPPTGPGWEFRPEAAARRGASIFDVAGDPIVLWREPSALASRAAKFEERLTAARDEAAAESGGEPPPPSAYYRSLDDLRRSAEALDRIALDRLGLGGEQGALAIPSQPAPRFQGNVAHAVRELRARAESGARALVCAASLGDLERLADIFSEFGVPYQIGLSGPDRRLSPFLREKAAVSGSAAAVTIVEAAVRAGVVFPEAKLLVVGSEDIFSGSELVAKPERRQSAASTFLSDLQDLQPGDLVVHAEHGVGRYAGMTKLAQGDRQEDLMAIEYADRAKLYVPLSRLDLVQKYHGAGGRPPALDRMGGQTWQKAKSRIKAKLVDMADELLKLYAERRLARGFAFSPDGPFQREFEDAFKYTPTADQVRATAELKADMESPQAMDRLVCGDVGFGKTEVAMRAAFKALGDDKQVAVLAPTTVLSFQHYETFRARFASFPVTVEMLNRFRSPKEQAETLERIAQGKVDVVVGTHRLLSKDVEFADLGLLIVDEEQRFGVRHKERFKQMRRDVDVLTLSATPIPRTLHMALAGLRDISIIQTPPKDRLSIHTVVAPSGDHLVKTAVEQEVSRGGQVYFIHNRVESIWARAAHVQQLVPGLRIGVGHGQMPEKELERVMRKFMDREYDMLMATTIVENGLDIPLANTIVIDDAQNYGLSELYQLRGRVGRSDRRAYAYLLIPPDRELTEVARKRLAALKEFSELGSGFKIAALDLELRGAGNLLGAEQSGHIAAVGFETYCRLLEDTVREISGEKVEEPVRSNLRLRIDIHIPTEYIADETQRLRAYKRLAEIADEEQRGRLEAELADRYGPPPAPVRNLMDYALLKSVTERLRIAAVERRGTQVTARFREDSKVDPARLMAAVSSTPGMSFAPGGELDWRNAPAEPPALIAGLRELFERIAA